MKKIIILAGITIAIAACNHNNPSGHDKTGLTDSSGAPVANAGDSASQATDSSTRGAYQSGDTSKNNVKADSLKRN